MHFPTFILSTKLSCKVARGLPSNDKFFLIIKLQILFGNVVSTLKQYVFLY